MHNIENEFLKVSVRNFGAELTSVLNKKNGVEHLWQADKKWWGWHAPVLFPIVGRCLNDQINFGEKTYPLEKHGFARKSDFELVAQTPIELTFSLKSSEATEKNFPFKFEFRIEYSLSKNKLQQRFEVINNSNETLCFSLGAHPAFNVPFNTNESFNDYFIEFEKSENLTRHRINNEGFFDGRKDLVSADGKIDLTPELFNDDALIFKDISSRSITIKSKKNTQQLKVSFSDFPYLGIWTKEGAPYVCIEPWLGCADTAGKPTDFTKKEGVLSLAANRSFSAAMFVEISAA